MPRIDRHQRKRERSDEMQIAETLRWIRGRADQRRVIQTKPFWLKRLLQNLTHWFKP